MEEYPVEYCDVCKCTNKEAGILDLAPVTDEMRAIFKIKPLPEIYSHFIYGHAMSKHDLYWYFFTPEQAEKMPEHICDNCFTKMFTGKEIFCWAYMIRQEGFSTMVIGKDESENEDNDHKDNDDNDNGFDNLKMRKKLFGLEEVESKVIKSFSCDECNTDLSQDHDIYEIKEITEKIRSTHNIPTEFTHFIRDHQILNYQIAQDRMSSNKFFLLPSRLIESKYTTSLICEECLRKRFINKKMTVIDFDKIEYVEFVVK